MVDMVIIEGLVAVPSVVYSACSGARFLLPTEWVGGEVRLFTGVSHAMMRDATTFIIAPCGLRNGCNQERHKM